MVNVLPWAGSNENIGRISGRGDIAVHPSGAWVPCSEPANGAARLTIRIVLSAASSLHGDVMANSLPSHSAYRQLVWSAVLWCERRVRRLVVGELFGSGIPFQVGFAPVCHVGDQCGRGTAMTILNVARRFLPALDTVQKVSSVIGIAHVPGDLLRPDKRLRSLAPAALACAVEGSASGKFVGRHDLRDDLVTVRTEIHRPFGPTELDLTGPTRGGGTVGVVLREIHQRIAGIVPEHLEGIGHLPIVVVAKLAP